MVNSKPAMFFLFETRYTLIRFQNPKGQYFYLRDHTPKSRRSRIQNAENQSDASDVPPETTLPDLKCKTANPNLQAFYYPWWATPDVDGQWAHWNHQVLPHWDERENKKYLIGKIHQVGFS